MLLICDRRSRSDSQLGWERWVQRTIETREVSVKMKDHRALLWEPPVREVAATIEEYLIRHSRNANAVFKEKTAETPVTGSRASRIA